MPYFGSDRIVPLNTLDQDPNLRSSAPLVMEIHKDVLLGDTGNNGQVTKTISDSALGKDKGEVVGVIALESMSNEANQVFGYSAAAGSSTGEVDLTVHSTNGSTPSPSSAAENVIRSVILVGYIYPETVS